MQSVDFPNALAVRPNINVNQETFYVDNQRDAPPSTSLGFKGNMDILGDARMCVTHSDCPNKTPLCIPGEYSNNLYEMAQDNQTGYERAIPLIGNFSPCFIVFSIICNGILY